MWGVFFEEVEPLLKRAHDTHFRTSSFIVSAWISPPRKEVYNYEVIHLNSRYCIDSDDLNEYLRDEVFEGLKNKDGLVYIVREVTPVYSVDYYGEADIEFHTKNIHESKCHSLSHLKEKWAELKNMYLSNNDQRGSKQNRKKR